MGFNLEMFIEELKEILESDKKASKKVKELAQRIQEGERYARECGQIK